VKVEASVVCRCHAEYVWQKFQDLGNWAWWNPAVGGARWLAGEPWTPGSRMRLELVRLKLTFEPVVIECAPLKLIHWQGNSLRCSGEQHFIFDPQPDGTTVLRAMLRLTGATPFLIPGIKQEAEKTIDIWLESLKTESEKLAREEAARSTA
jgi:hypothetical protein